MAFSSLLSNGLGSNNRFGGEPLPVPKVTTRNHYFWHMKQKARRLIIDTMNLSLLHRPILRLIGVSVWLIASVPTVLDVLRYPHETTAARLIVWVIAFGLFGVSFWITSSVTSDFTYKGRSNRALYVPLIALQTVATLVMLYLIPCYSIGILLVIVAWQLPSLLAPWPTLIWLLAQTAALSTILYLGHLSNLTMFATNTSLGFQLFAFVTATIAKRESRARQELMRTNAELRATRELLEESSRVNERARMSGDLHDILGHNLTALNIHLEVAKHVCKGKALTHVEKSQALAKSILQDVRSVVSAVQGEAEIDMRGAIEELVAELPFPRIHLDVCAPLRVANPACAHTILRCVQEVITNTLRHSNAKNLWIRIEKTNSDIEVRVRDDGRGAKSIEMGNGLLGMRKRLEQIGGRIQFDSAHGQGFRVDAWVPITEAVS